MKWTSYDSSVYLIKPSLDQCQEVISKLKKNNYRGVILRNSSSYTVQFLLPHLLKIETIISISISSTKVTKDIISSQLTNNATLERLLVIHGSINDDGVITLAQSLKSNKSITTLCLYNNPDITSASAQSLAELLLNNHTLEVLNLFNTNIDANGVSVLVKCFKTNKTLRELRLNKQLEEISYSLPYYQTIKNRLFFW